MNPTPTSAVSSQPKYASFGRRLVGHGVDALILFILGWIVQTAIGQNPLKLFSLTTFEELQKLQSSTSYYLSLILSWGLAYSYFAFFWVNFTATPGQRLAAIKITGERGEAITYVSAFIRLLGSIASATVFYLGFLWVIWDPKKQAWHDKMAKTIVVETDDQPHFVIATLVAVVAWVVIFGYMLAAFVWGVRLGFKSIKTTPKEETVVAHTAVAITQAVEAMSPEVKKHYERSQALFAQMKKESDPAAVKRLNDENITELKAATQLDPANAHLWEQLGAAYTWVSTAGTFEDGLAAYQKAEELDPKNFLYMYEVGDMLNRMGRFDEAVLQFKKVLRATGDNYSYGHMGLATSYQHLKIYKEAREEYQKAIDGFTKDNKDGSFDDEILTAQKAMASLPQQ